MNKHAHDPRKSILVNGNAYRRALEAQRALEARSATAGDTLTDIIAGLSMLSFLVWAGFLLAAFA